MKNIIGFLLLVSISACSTTRIASIGPDTYLVQRKGGSGYVSASGLKMDALDAANEYCISMKKQAVILSTQETPVAFASTPSADVQFRCLSEGDKDLNRPILSPTASTTIEVKK